MAFPAYVFLRRISKAALYIVVCGISQERVLVLDRPDARVMLLMQNGEFMKKRP
jgi:hypothetical protein